MISSTWIYLWAKIKSWKEWEYVMTTTPDLIDIERWKKTLCKGESSCEKHKPQFEYGYQASIYLYQHHFVLIILITCWESISLFWGIEISVNIFPVQVHFHTRLTIRIIYTRHFFLTFQSLIYMYVFVMPTPLMAHTLNPCETQATWTNKLITNTLYRQS